MVNYTPVKKPTFRVFRPAFNFESSRIGLVHQLKPPSAFDLDLHPPHLDEVVELADDGDDLKQLGPVGLGQLLHFQWHAFFTPSMYLSSPSTSKVAVTAFRP